MQQSLLGRLLLLGGTLLHAIAAVTYNCSASESCGCSANPAVLSRIVGGEQAGSRTWGWAASLRYATTDSHFCGGSIISAWHILTAAHCIVQFNSPSLLRVNVGSVYAASAPQTRSVAKIYKHPAYSPSTDRNDIAMLKLTSALDLDQAGVDLVCLPNVSSTVLASQEYPAAGQSLVAIGWGVTAAGNTWTSSTLQQVTVQAVAASSSYCRRMQLQDVSTQFCAGVMPQGGKDTCQGDSGGPLLRFTANNVWEQVGVTSIGHGCAEAYYPGVYTRVAAFQAWINATMNHGSRPATTTLTMSILLIVPVLLS